MVRSSAEVAMGPLIALTTAAVSQSRCAFMIPGGDQKRAGGAIGRRYSEVPRGGFPIPRCNGLRGGGEEPPGINTGFWRGVGPNNTVFAIESFIDELARKAGQDPIAFRRAHLGKEPRLHAALDLV